MSRREWTLVIPAGTPWLTVDQLPLTGRLAGPWRMATIRAARDARLPYLPSAHLAAVVCPAGTGYSRLTDMTIDELRATLDPVGEGLVAYGLVPAIEPDYVSIEPLRLGARLRPRTHAVAGELRLTIRDRIRPPQTRRQQV